MPEVIEVSSLIENGDVVHNIEGTNLESVYHNACMHFNLPEGLTVDSLEKELLNREKVLSTAVGNGIAIPHPRRPLLKENQPCRLLIAFINHPLDMHAPDYKNVSVLFILLSNSSVVHVKALSAIAKILKNDRFRKSLMMKPNKTQLVEIARQLEQIQ